MSPIHFLWSVLLTINFGWTGLLIAFCTSATYEMWYHLRLHVDHNKLLTKLILQHQKRRIKSECELNKARIVIQNLRDSNQKETI